MNQNNIIRLLNLLHSCIDPHQWDRIADTIDESNDLNFIISILNEAGRYGQEAYLGKIDDNWGFVAGKIEYSEKINRIADQITTPLLGDWIKDKFDHLSYDNKESLDFETKKILATVILLSPILEDEEKSTSSVQRFRPPKGPLITDSKENSESAEYVRDEVRKKVLLKLLTQLNLNEIVTLFRNSPVLESKAKYVWENFDWDDFNFDDLGGPVGRKLTDEKLHSLIAALQDNLVQLKSGSLNHEEAKANLASLMDVEPDDPDFQTFIGQLSSHAKGQGTWAEKIKATNPRRARYLDIPKTKPETLEQWTGSPEQLSLPQGAKGDDLNDALFAFTKRVYGAGEGGLDLLRDDYTGLALSDLKTLDKPLQDELTKAKKRLNNKNPSQTFPDDFPMPTRQERNRAVIEKINDNELDVPTDFKERMNLSTAASRMNLPFRPASSKVK